MWAVLARDTPYSEEWAERGLNVWKLRELIVGGGRPTVDDHPVIQKTPVAAVLLMKQCWEQGAGPVEAPERV
jgi:hypothetical protein